MTERSQPFEAESILAGLRRWVEIETPTGDVENMARLLDDLHSLPKPIQKNLLAKFQLAVEAVADVHHLKDKRPRYVREDPEWHILTSRN